MEPRELDCWWNVYISDSQLQRRSTWYTVVFVSIRHTASGTDGVTVTEFCSISMPVDFRRHLVGKNSEKCLPL